MSTPTTNILNANVHAFPSSNSNTQGKPTSELNLREIITRLHIQDFIVSDLTTYPLQLSGTTLTIPEKFQVNLNGALITFDDDQTITLPSTTTEVWLCLWYDSADHIYGQESGTSNIQGVYVDFAEPTDTDKKGIQIANVVSGTFDTTFKPVVCPISSDNIQVNSNGSTLSEYVNTTATNTYLSKIADDTKTGNITFTKSGETETVVIDYDSIQIKDSSAVKMNLSGDTISSTSDINVTSGDNLKVTGTTDVTLEVNGTQIVVKNDNTIEIGNVKLTIGSTDVTISGPSTININNTTDTTVNIKGDLNVTGEIKGSKVYGAVFN